MFDTEHDWSEFVGAGAIDLTTDSRCVTQGSVFLAYPGEDMDGRDYIPSAIDAGACGIFWDADNFTWRDEWQVLNCPVHRLREKAGYLASEFYAHPSRQLAVIAVTGTNGKTTISHFTAQLLDAAGKNTGVIGTLGAGGLEQLISLNNTTPDAVALHQLLRQFIEEKKLFAVIEASSHGIVQGRLNGVQLQSAVFSNAGRDHLDYHSSLEDYWNSKAALFDLPGIQTAILNADDPFCASLAEKLSSTMTTMTYGKNGHEMRLLDLDYIDGVYTLRVDGIGGCQHYCLKTYGEHNVSNFLASCLLATLSGVNAGDIARLAPTLTLPQGRMECIGYRPMVIVDFAHTPDAMHAVFLSTRRAMVKPGRLFVVFGCGGDRDKDKRYEMGCLAAEMADEIFVTDDNPRHEDSHAIREEILRGVPDAKNISDRRLAIEQAILQAKSDDVVLILGKGHEATQCVGDVQNPFSDIAVARDILDKISCN